MVLSYLMQAFILSPCTIVLQWCTTISFKITTSPLCLFVLLFQKFEGYLLASIKAHLEDRYTDKMEEIYTTMIKFVIKHMTEGLEAGG